MDRVMRITAVVLVCFCLSLISGCSHPQTADGTQSPTEPSKSDPSKPEPAASQPQTPLIVPANQSQPGLGGIKVGSRPPGATIMLIPEEGGGAGRPQLRGSTPTTITDLAPGKYTVHLEARGYKAFQKDVEVKPDETTSVVSDMKPDAPTRAVPRNAR